MQRRLHIGGEIRAQSWEIFNIMPGPEVDHQGDARDLSRFEDSTFIEIYAAHVLEHFNYINELESVLKEWFRVLVPGGKLYISVPDLDTLAQLIAAKDKLTIQERFLVMQMMFGGQLNMHDFHHFGLNEEFLAYFLSRAGFGNMWRVKSFGFFQDSSEMSFKAVSISLNVIAEKPVS